MKPFVFLGGSCDPTTWRRDVAIPLLLTAGVPFSNPQVPDWAIADARARAAGVPGGMAEVEAAEKARAAVLLFVIDGQTRAIVSMIEAVSQAGLGRRVCVTVQDIPDGTTIDGQVITGRELEDLNRARTYLRNELARHPSASVRPSVTAAVQAAILAVRNG